MREKISVLMTVYNAEKYIKKSVQSIISQSYKNFELLIVDDCSTDKSLELIKRFKDKRIRLLALKKHIGRTKSLNYGLKKIKNSFIAIFDADDISYKNRLECQLKFLKKNLDIDLIGTWYELIDGQNKIFQIKKFSTNIDIIKKEMFYNNIFCHSSIMFRKKILKKIKKYPEKFVYMQDYAFLLQVLKNYKMFILPNILVKSRVTSSSMTYTLPSKLIIQERLNLLSFSYKYFSFDYLTKINWVSWFLKTRFKLAFGKN